MRYRSVGVTLPDGTHFRLGAPELAITAVRVLNLKGHEPETMLIQQVIPLLHEHPEVLLELATRLSWPEARSLAKQAFWRSPANSLGTPFKGRAKLSLHT